MDDTKNLITLSECREQVTEAVDSWPQIDAAYDARREELKDAFDADMQHKEEKPVCNVVRLPCVTSLDLQADVVIEEAHGKMDKVVIIGYDKDGKEYFASSMADGGDVVWLLERMKLKLLEAYDR
jgi:hypothetical protein